MNPYLLGRDFNKEAGITGLEETRRSFDTGSFPDFAWTGYTSLTGSAFDQRPKTQDRYTREFVDNLAWIKGNHVFKFGTKIRYYSWLGTDSKEYMGPWTFNGQNTENPASAAGTGDSFADWVLGLPSSANRAYPSDTFGGDYTAWHFYLQDDIKVTSTAHTEYRACAMSTRPSPRPIAGRPEPSTELSRGRSSSPAIPRKSI